jgi:hypothetical protein
MSHIESLPLDINLPIVGHVGLDDIPAVPLVLDQWLGTLARLGARELQTLPAKHGLSNVYTLGGVTAPAHTFLYGPAPENAAAKARDVLVAALHQNAPPTALGFARELFDANVPRVAPPVHPLTALPLERPEQFALSWTTFQDIEQNARPLLPGWSATLADADAADAAFFPLIARYGLPFFLLILQKIAAAKIAEMRNEFAAVWTPAFDAAYAAGRLYAIDLRIFSTLKPQTVHGATRFTPATLTLLVQDPATKRVVPVAVAVAGHGGAGRQVYSRATATPSAWLYALQAAKTSVTVYGIWLGHVYHWHMVTAAMQMTMYNTVAATHPLYALLEPQSDYLMAFDNILLALWSHVAPPTSVSSGFQFLELMNTFAKGRNFFDDDPLATLARHGLTEADFSVAAPWDAYPLVGQMLKIWRATTAYVGAFVTATYADDAAVQNDATLQAWMAASATKGNIRGLPNVATRAMLSRVLTSLVYRVTMHGCARLSPIANPGLSFVANFPPCLQSATIPPPTQTLTTAELLRFLPNTGSIGEMITFLDVFSFSVPYEPFVPIDGVEAQLFFPGGPADPRNAALIEFRRAIIALNTELSAPSQPQIHQWPLNIET